MIRSEKSGRPRASPSLCSRDRGTFHWPRPVWSLAVRLAACGAGLGWERWLHLGVQEFESSGLSSKQEACGWMGRAEEGAGRYLGGHLPPELGQRALADQLETQ